MIEQFKPFPIDQYNFCEETPAEKAIRLVVETSGLYGEDAAILEYQLMLKAGLCGEHPCFR